MKAVNVLRVLTKIPFPRKWKLSWQRSLVDRIYAKEIDEALKAKDRDKVKSLRFSHRFETEMYDEEEDAHITGKLLKQPAVSVCLCSIDITQTPRSRTIGIKGAKRADGISR